MIIQLLIKKLLNYKKGIIIVKKLELIFNIKEEKMRKTVAIFIITLITVAFAKAQLVYPNYQDGIIYFKLNDDVEFKVNEDLTVDLSEFPTLQHIFDKYEITALSRPFYLFDNKDLLQTIRAEFLKVKK